MPSPDEQPENLSLLLVEMQKQSKLLLEGILKDIIKNSPEGRKIASEWLLAPKADVKTEPVLPVSSTARVTSEVAVTSARVTSEQEVSVPMTSRFANCIYCMEKFDVTRNSETSCRYHVELDIIDEEMCDKDEIAYGLGYDGYDTEEYREAWPKMFFHPCCGRDLTEDMCQVGWHKAVDPDERPRKRTRRDYD
ncbi:hypothetical protein DTO006G1_2875 [Penicillium roqueforti]|uniref:uncharacterized protein n=1 Tax=Penicillium roqueforti TaxID=5082 RepID=UPI00190CF6B4|nr:uncharacterized protein LCP9604111_2124 [Penicillium roqueforti]KAF9252128.1 hypothetical protein LCP9604111_2124 [Penicillium roqueforti]KAI1837397.1 hypothetical protein CBS147337_1680 [Penicillium roqueforti]KAI2687835.1 hypothetical protein LCP963914a_3353 [Penicillium roqueforti]KAI2689791.1 hypothetical protein CBS147355_242 [Penicillium roqueforti]KAI2702334.1 hypothetical protein CBS147372_4067 [Penicillium roqueforti]